jgi:dual specificity phosphatase 12
MKTWNWITEQIAIGNLVAAKNIVEEQFDIVICLTGCCDGDDDKDICREIFPLNDGPGNSKLKIIQAVESIQEAVEAGDRVLVHCHAGQSRSVCIVALWMMQYQGLAKSEALTLISWKRDILLSPGIGEIFQCIFYL